jgi:hypothetical protein
MIPPFLFSNTRQFVSQALSIQIDECRSNGNLKG